MKIRITEIEADAAELKASQTLSQNFSKLLSMAFAPKEFAPKEETEEEEE